MDILEMIILLILFIVNGSKALSIVEVTIPTAVRAMDTATLSCKFDLEGEPLYTVKWYFGMSEFFRYIPKEHPNMLTFPTAQGLDVDLSKSTANKVVLRNMRPAMSGKYMCEVSTDLPNFYTKRQQSYLYVVDVPVVDPLMFIQKGPLQFGYTIQGNCSSPPSFPAANVTWYLNDQKINSTTRTYLDPNSILMFTSKNRRIPKITTSNLYLEIDGNTFVNGKADIKCVVNLFDLYKKEKQEIFYEENPHPRPSSVLGVRESSAAGRFFPRIDILLLIILEIFTSL